MAEACKLYCESEWIEYNPKGRTQTIEDVVDNIRALSPRTCNTAKAIRWHFFPDSNLLQTLQTQVDERKIEKFRDYVYDTNEFTLLKQGYWLLLRVFDENRSVWRLRKVENFGEELAWNETRTDADILKKLKQEWPLACMTP